MKKLIVLAFLACLVFGFFEWPRELAIVAIPSGPPSAPKPKMIAELDRICRLRHLRFRIYCTDGARWKFQADAQHSSQPENAIYVEEGALPWWVGTGNTQEEAAESLFLNIATHKEGEMLPEHSYENRHRECPPEIDGGEVSKD